ncbi:MAG: membrane protein insertase YidC [Desulfofustis sp. PB-SRB1]|jgi:YidC/Oxa1 family membrane protein insertase|nr:membrane protein insertase YidC [Desulfofustis sp. PB-SRB1]MBM1001312.1 membrane protein insertase YidC [Desulfofustis sp. PB-SRB1]HBH28923.1 membrane protein insertase YidC [Desulfofustis sp.]HBH30378.1 membrane protein insertase YidC [Desulfofustis sp.]
MDMQRAVLAVAISFLILFGYQYFFVGPIQQQQQPPPAAVEQSPQQPPATQAQLPDVSVATVGEQIVDNVQPQRTAREITIETDLYTAVLSEQGGAFTSFVLKDYREENSEDAAGVQLIKDELNGAFPLTFGWGAIIAHDTLYTLDSETVRFDQAGGQAQVVMRAAHPIGVEVIRTYTFNREAYQIEHQVVVRNISGQPLQGDGVLRQYGMPFVPLGQASNWLFRGPALFGGPDGLQQFKLKKFADGPITVQDTIDWAAYEDVYFMLAMLPKQQPVAVIMDADDELVSIDLRSESAIMAAGGEQRFEYTLFYGPKKVEILREVGSNLAKIVNFGWLDVISKPMLYLLNWLYGLVHNYGVAIIIVTIILKAIFWPITHKGLKSMKNMQKLQPKMVKIKEKYKGDPTKMNQEMMNLYKTYKVNPLGGCLPMLLQIPVFFALYRVLLQSIELRHAPFMLWITDLSAPDRLYLGFDIPYLGGLPVLTLLMGASMFLQQKMTPTTADPTQAKIMMFLPLIFTVMFVNFASGLVLYWFVNNLLSILQQYTINRQKKPTPAAA